MTIDWNAFQIILTGSLVAASCALLGCFLVLRKIAMLGDAISHAILPGIALAFILSESRAPLWMFTGAAVIGLLTTFLVEALSRGGVQGDAAMGITFTALFAWGVYLISRYSGSVDLDLDCVLFGEITFVSLERLIIGGVDLGPPAAWANGGLLLLNVLLIGLFYKQFKLCSFDPGLAAAVGINVTAIHYLLMAQVAVTTVGAFESVGAILVVAMIIVPAATAYLLTDQLYRMIVYAMGLGVLSAIVGYYTSVVLSCSPAGAMASVAGLFFAGAFLASPRYGLVSRALQQRRMRRHVAREDVLLWAGRLDEAKPGRAFRLDEIAGALSWSAAEVGRILGELRRQDYLRQTEAGFRLTPAGQQTSRQLMQRHRVYETYLGNLGYASDHVHSPADRVEHFLSPVLTERMDREVGRPETDPHGEPIPRD